MPIYKKLLEFQKKNVSLKRDGENPHFRSTYVTLNEVLDKVKKPLNNLGILILQEPMQHGLLTRLVDTEDDSQVTGFMPYVEATTAQKLGSNNTYVRRYTLVTLLGLEEDDDDGNEASTNAPQTPYKPQGAMQSYGHDKLATEKQKKLIRDLAEQQHKPIPEEAWFEALTMATARASIDKLMLNNREDLPTITQE